MTVKLLTQLYCKFEVSKGAAQARLSLHLSKCHIVGNHMSRLIYVLFLSKMFQRSSRKLTVSTRIK